jgi:crossover junction endodeoxyribonuclease RusA
MRSSPQTLSVSRGDVIAVYIYGRPDRRRRDPSNLEKAIGDTLTRRGALEDDSQIVNIRLRWAAPSEIKPGECRVELSELVTASVGQP